MKRPHISQELLTLCRGLRKTELHAHLNGSLRDSTLRYEGTASQLSRQRHEEDLHGNETGLALRNDCLSRTG